MARYQFDPARSALSIDGRSSVHPIRASFDGVVGWIELDDSGDATAGRVTVHVDRVSTGNPLYDREIRNRRVVITEQTGDRANGPGLPLRPEQPGMTLSIGTAVILSSACTGRKTSTVMIISTRCWNP